MVPEREMILAQQRPLRIWYSRDPGFSSFDPLEQAVATRAQVHVSESVPLPGMLEGYDGLIIACSGYSALHLQYRAAQAAQEIRPTLIGVTGPVREAEDAAEPPVSLPLSLEELDGFLMRVRDEAEGAADLRAVA